MLVIDLQQTPLMDGAGLETLVELREKIEARGGSVKLAAVNALCAAINAPNGSREYSANSTIRQK